MHRLIVLACLVLAACSSPLPQSGGPYRNADAPIYSSAAFDPVRLAGTWVQVATFALPIDPACPAGSAKFNPSTTGLTVAARLCLSGAETRVAGAIDPAGPGRLALRKPGRDMPDPWWVLWVDSGYRTVVIGTPSGQFGFILNRDKGLPADRLTAAREVLDFNGYDTKKLGVFGR